MAQRVEVETAVYFGAVWKHTPKLTTQTGELLWGQEFGVRFQTMGQHDWQAWQRYPIWGASFVYFQLGDSSHGDGFGLLPNLSIPIVRSHKFAAFFRLGTGLAWITHPYDYFDNPNQNAVSSHWNNITQFRLGGELRCSDHLKLNTGASLTHFSNGGTSLPNYGINIPAGYLGLVWSPRPVREEDFLTAKTNKHPTRRLGGLVQMGLAINEYGVFDGPKYPIWAGAAAGYFHFNKINRALLGLDYEFNKAVYEYGLYVADFENEEQARKGATRLAIFVADEFLFGIVGIQLQMGHYVGKNLNQLTAKPNYSKLTTRVYFPKLFKTSFQPHVGITLKAHATTAEYISMNAGLAF